LFTSWFEVIHADFDTKSILKAGLPQHHEIITPYVDCELAALQSMFPNLSSKDDLCFILGGMADVQQYYSATFNSVLSTYNLTLNDVVNTNNNYKSAGVGHGCGL
jgi:hypothetical protein